LEQKIEAGINDQKLQDMYKKTLEGEVLGLFESRLIPKVDEYFRGLFVDLGKVFEQGISYYSQKLAIEADVQRDCFRKIVEHTFKSTNELLEIGKQ
jgi:hypothetical protein